MRFLTHRAGDLSTYFDIIDKSEDDVNDSSWKQVPIKNKKPDKERINRRTSTSGRMSWNL